MMYLVSSIDNFSFENETYSHLEFSVLGCSSTNLHTCLNKIYNLMAEKGFDDLPVIDISIDGYMLFYKLTDSHYQLKQRVTILVSLQND